MEFIKLKSMDNMFGINKMAQIINFKTNRILKTYIGSDCYEHVVLHMHGKKYRKRVHRLMAEAFFNNAKYIDHIDNNRSNNILTNLQPITNSDNIKKAYAETYHKSTLQGNRVPVVATNKDTHETYVFDSMRKCEQFTGVDRHRIKTFLENKRPNYTQFIFSYNE